MEKSIFIYFQIYPNLKGKKDSLGTNSIKGTWNMEHDTRSGYNQVPNFKG